MAADGRRQFIFISALALIFFSPPDSPAAGPARAAWHTKSSPHFEVYHEGIWSPGAISLELERMYSSMCLDMAMFAPWMVREKTRIYIYSGQESYLAGEFSPPKWSKGLAYLARKTVVVYDTGDMAALKAVIAHELSHLYFESYFAEKLRYPPQWLNEGLAVLMEDKAYSSGGPWAAALPYMTKERLVEFDRFFGVKIGDLPGDRQIGDWYLQSYGIVAYLLRSRQRLQFKNFCGLIRDGEATGEALWKIYREKSPLELQRRWLSWTMAINREPSGGFSINDRGGGFEFKQAEFSSFGFTKFGKKEKK